MTTLGQKAATQHVSLQKQTITGNGGTSYTLQQSVGSALDVAVFVNNTRQEPTVAYSASGTTLTMTGAVNSSDNFYVIFLGKAITTTGLPAPTDKFKIADYGFLQTTIYKEGQTGEITLPTSFQMIKGHRGSYLSGAIDDIFRDGWGTSGTADFATNHGWDVTATATTFQVNSFGMDGQPNQLTGDPYEEDVAMSPSIFAEDWQVDVSGASVRVINRTSVNINLGSAVSFTAALLVYQNDTTSSWQTVETLTTDVTSLDNGNGLDNASAAWGESQDFVVTFPTGSTNIPVGEHLLVLVAGNDPDLRNNGIGTSPNYVTTRVKFYPRGGVPDMVLEIR